MSPLSRFVSTSSAGIAAMLMLAGWLDTTTGLNEKGNKAFQNKRYETALEAYRKAQIRKPSQPEIRYNVGTTLYQMDQFQEAEAQLASALHQSGASAPLQAQAWYNYGNTQYRLGQFDQAIDAYRKTLDINPKDTDAKYNLELLQKKKKLFEDKQNKRDQENKKDRSENQKNQTQENQSRSQQKQNQKGGSGAEDRETQDQDRQKGQQGSGQQDEQEASQRPEQEEGENMSPDEREQGQEGGAQPKDPGDGPPQKPAEGGAGSQQGEKPEPANQGRALPLYQGQMSKENAMRILNALQQGEQELQILKRPTKPHQEREPEKDW